MKPEQQRIAIAKAHGYTRNDGTFLDYPNDLNAMHEAENSLSSIEQCQFAEKLFRVMVGEHGVSDFMKIHATAAQRAEAFLRTIGKWGE
jgi:hypothetical protein